MPMQVRGAVAYVARSKAVPVLSKDRRGYRGGSISATIGSRDGIVAGHFVERDTRLIEGMSFVGPDRLTARDQAVYELLLAVAREQGVERDFHQVDVRAVRKFLRAREWSTKRSTDCRLDRIRESVDRLSGTIVRHRHQNRYGAAYAPGPLVKAELHVDPECGKAIVDFSLADPVRHAIATSRSYTWLELDAFTGFTNRYTARLYRFLALRAGYDGSLGKRWEIAPIDLARLLNYPIDGRGALHLASFERRCVNPALADITREVRAFRVSCRRRPVAGRGASFDTIVFEIVRHPRPLHHHKAADVAARLAPLAAAGRYPADHLPSRLVLGRAETMTGHTAEKLHEGWQVALDRAKADPQAECIPDLPGYVLLQTIRWRDADTAFAEWAEAVHRHGSIPTPARVCLHPVDPDTLEPSMRFLVNPGALQALRTFAGKMLGTRKPEVVETLLAAEPDDMTMQLVVKADTAIGGRLMAACRHAAAEGLEYRQWGIGLMLLSGGRPKEAIEAFDDLLSGPRPNLAFAPATVAVNPAREQQTGVARDRAASVERDLLHEPADLSGLMDDPEPPAFHTEESDDSGDDDETDAIPY